MIFCLLLSMIATGMKDSSIMNLAPRGIFVSSVGIYSDIKNSQYNNNSVNSPQYKSY